MIRNLPALHETRVWSQGWEEPLEKRMANHSSILAWRIPWTEEPGGLQSMGSQRVGHNWVTNTHTHTRTHITEELEMQYLAWESAWGCWEYGLWTSLYSPCSISPVAYPFCTTVFPCGWKNQPQISNSAVLDVTQITKLLKYSKLLPIISSYYFKPKPVREKKR